MNALRLQDLEALPRPGSAMDRIDPDACKAAFWRYVQQNGLEWPDDVVEQFLFDHGSKPEFIADYGHLDLRAIVWAEEDMTAADLLRASASKHLKGRITDVSNALEHYASGYGRDRWGWEDHHTWLRSPILIEGNLLRPPRKRPRLIEGHTRMGALKGYVREGSVRPSSLHRVWLGTERRSTTA